VETTGALEGIIRQVQNAVGDMVRSYLVLDTPARSDGAETVLLDPAHKVADIFGARHGLVALVRPDGYLGYRGHLDQRGELASYLARVFAMRLPEVET
jgi:hypothetical protein